MVDDEPDAREFLKELIEADPNLELVGSHGDPVAALEAIGRERPDVLFLDVEMPKLNGFELLMSLDWDHLPIIVFTTAYNEYAVRAFEVSAADYLLKPFTETRFKAATARIATTLELRTRGGAVAEPDRETSLRRLLKELSESRQGGTGRIAVKAGHRIRLLPTDLIDFVEAEGNAVRICAGAETYSARVSISAMQDRLEPEGFLRVHRKFLVNVSRVVELEPLFRGEYILVMRGGRRIGTGRTYRDSIRETFELSL